jgi:hypothetical protein
VVFVPLRQLLSDPVERWVDCARGSAIRGSGVGSPRAQVLRQTALALWTCPLRNSS